VRIVFFGTPEFAVPSLQALVEQPDMDVVLVVTQPDRPSGRGRAAASPPAALAAVQRRVPLAQPERIRDNPALVEQLRGLGPDVIVVAAYGRILPEEILRIPPLGCVNVHASLLSRHRGASPVAAALLAGDPETGVSIMAMTAGLDEGPVYAVQSTRIAAGEDRGSLTRRLSRLGAELLVSTLREIAAGRAVSSPQAGVPTYCRLVLRGDGEIDWALPADEIERRSRAYSPWPGLFTFLDGTRVKVIGVGPVALAGAAKLAPGTIAPLPDGGVAVVCGGGTALAPEHLQREGKRQLSAREFARGLNLAGKRFERG